MKLSGAQKRLFWWYAPASLALPLAIGACGWFSSHLEGIISQAVATGEITQVAAQSFEPFLNWLAYVFPVAAGLAVILFNHMFVRGLHMRKKSLGLQHVDATFHQARNDLAGSLNHLLRRKAANEQARELEEHTVAADHIERTRRL